MNIPIIIAQNVSNKLRNEEIQDEARASFVNYTTIANYNNNILHYRQICENVYGKLPYIADSTLGNLFRKIKEIMTNAGITIEQMIHQIRFYLGYNASMKRLDKNGNTLFLNPIQIQEAWQASVSDKGIMNVENALYLN